MAQLMINEKEIQKKYKLTKPEMENLKRISKTAWLRLDKLINYIQKYPSTKITEYHASKLYNELKEMKSKLRKEKDVKTKKNLQDKVNAKYVEWKVVEFCHFNALTTMKIKGIPRKPETKSKAK